LVTLTSVIPIGQEVSAQRRLLVVDTHHFVRWIPAGFAFFENGFRMSTVVFSSS